MFGMGHGHICEDKTGLSKARRLANVGIESLYNFFFFFFEAESLLHMGTNTKKKDLYWQGARRKSLRGTRLYKF